MSINAIPERKSLLKEQALCRLWATPEKEPNLSFEEATIKLLAMAKVKKESKKERSTLVTKTSPSTKASASKKIPPVIASQIKKKRSSLIKKKRAVTGKT